MKKIVLTAGLATALAVGPAGAVFAADYTEHPAGGTWKYGSTYQSGVFYLAYSNYYHGSATHKATTCINNTSNCNASGWKPEGVWAYSDKLYDDINTPKRYWDKL